MTLKLGSRLKWSRSLVAAAVMLASVAASAQTSPPDQPAPGEPPASPEPSVTMPVTPKEPLTLEGESFPKMGKSHEIMVGKEIWFRFGLQAQVWYDALQSNVPTTAGDGAWSQQMFMRRARLIVAAQLMKNVNIWFQFDAPRIGGALSIAGVTVNADGTAAATSSIGKRFNAQDGGGEILQDAWGEIKLAGDAFMLEVGLMVIPFGRNELQSTTTFISLDLASISALVPNTSGTRDVGFELKGYELDDHLEFRAGLFSGNRQSANGTNPLGHNFFRLTGFVQYEIFDPEKGYVFAGHNFGKKKILAVSAGVDFQKNDQISGQTITNETYFGASGAIAGSWPLSGEASKTGGDEISFVLQYYRYQGGPSAADMVAAPNLVPGAPSKQNDFLGEVGYYNKDASLSVFGKFEMQRFADDALKGGNFYLFGGGIKYYIWENFCNFTLAYNRQQFPDAPTTGTGARNSTNEITFQTQIFYY
jgi:Phosphate-selective porin O and P